MAQKSVLEPFPSASAHQLLSQDGTTGTDKSSAQRRRTKSNSLPGEPRGDTGAAALSTMSDQKLPPPAPPVTRTPSEKRGRRWKRRKAKSLFLRWRSISVRHTWLNPLILVLLVLGAYAIKPGPDNIFRPAIFLSYPLPRKLGEDASTPIQYGKGGFDFVFVAFYTIVLSFTREFLMQRLIRPLAVLAGITSRAKQSRFMEQLYTAMYFGVFGPFGLYVMKRTPVWYFNDVGMFEGFPHRQHEGLFKAYYLLQAAYWAQQAIVLLLQLEKPRKDFKELVAHHCLTLALIWLSYRFHFMYMGLAVYITHDVSDFFLATSKVLNYLDSAITGPYFVFFMGVWIYLRHYINLHILWAVLTTFRTVGPFELNWDTQQYKCWISQYITFALLAALQGVNVFWLVFIIRIASRYVFSNDLQDERSDAGSNDDAASGEGETTAEKRERMGLPPSEGVDLVTGAAQNGPAKVLLNGKPVAENGDVGIKQVEVQAQQRRRKV